MYVQEDPEDNGSHTAEKVAYLVLEAGVWELANGTLLEEGRISSDATVGKRVNNQWGATDLIQPFTTPVVLSQPSVLR